MIQANVRWAGLHLLLVKAVVFEPEFIEFVGIMIKGFSMGRIIPFVPGITP